MGRYQPAILGGLFIGVLSSLPVVNAANLCCCLWVIAGGVLVTYLLQQKSPTPIATSEAALQGIFAGVIGGLLVAGFQIAMASIAGPMVLDQVRDQLSSNPEIPAEMRDTILRFLTGTNLVVLTLLITVPMYAVFSMAGSFLGLAFFRKKVPPQPQA